MSKYISFDDDLNKTMVYGEQVFLESIMYASQIVIDSDRLESAHTSGLKDLYWKSLLVVVVVIVILRFKD